VMIDRMLHTLQGLRHMIAITSRGSYES